MIQTERTEIIRHPNRAGGLGRETPTIRGLAFIDLVHTSMQNKIKELQAWCEREKNLPLNNSQSLSEQGKIIVRREQAEQVYASRLRTSLRSIVEGLAIHRSTHGAHEDRIEKAA